MNDGDRRGVLVGLLNGEIVDIKFSGNICLTCWQFSHVTEINFDPEAIVDMVQGKEQGYEYHSFWYCSIVCTVLGTNRIRVMLCI